MGARDRSIRFVFDTVVDSYASGRPDMPIDSVRRAAEAVVLPPRAHVLEVGAGCGQLTWALAEVGYEVVALEPGEALRSRARARVPTALFHAATFEDFEPDREFDAIFSSNAWHWIDPDVGYAKAAELGDAIVLIWDTAIAADAELRRAIQEDVLDPRGVGSFPIEEPDVREFVDAEVASVCDGLTASGRFDEPLTDLLERRLNYTPERYVDLIGSMGLVAASGRRNEILADLRPLLGDDSFEVVDLVWTIAARAA